MTDARTEDAGEVASPPMTPVAALARLRELAKMTDANPSRHRTEAHIEADGILCDLLRALGHPEVAEAFDDVGKWYE